MGREIVTNRDLATRATARAGAEQKDEYKDRLLKYIPAETVAVYLALSRAITTATNPSDQQGSDEANLLWIVFAVLLVGTWLYLQRVQKVTKVKQLIISTVAFAVWIFSIGGPFELSFGDPEGWYKPIYGAVLLPLYTFFIPIIEPDPGDA